MSAPYLLNEKLKPFLGRYINSFGKYFSITFFNKILSLYLSERQYSGLIFSITARNTSLSKKGTRASIEDAIDEISALYIRLLGRYKNLSKNNPMGNP